ncbi:MAG: hypothetical protein R3F49_15690 [Planctomycetota bacterium]
MFLPACASLSLAFASIPAPQAQFVDLGPTQGSFVGRASLGRDGSEALVQAAWANVGLWSSRSGARDFVPPGVSLASGSSLYGAALDAAGETIAFTSLPASGGGQQDLRAEVWAPASGRQTLATPPNGSGLAVATAISGDGQFVVGAFEPAGVFNAYTEAYLACRWTAQGQALPLGQLPGGEASSVAVAISDDGAVVVGNDSVALVGNGYGVWSIDGGFVWTAATGIQAITQPAEDFLARDVSGDGQVIVGSGRGPASGAPSVALRRVAGQPIEELVSPQGTSFCLATNLDGTVIIGYVTGGAVSPYTSYTGTFVWVEGQGAFALADYLTARGAVLPASYTLTRALQISADGSAILGLGLDAANVQHVWLAYAAPPRFEFGAATCAPAQVNSAGHPASLHGVGFGYLGGGGVALEVADAPPGATCLFLASRAGGSVLFPGGSQGELCLGGSIGRFAAPQEVRVADASGAARLPLDLASLPQPAGRVAVQPGETWHFQCWYRDANPGPTSNFTSGLVEGFEP